MAKINWMGRLQNGLRTALEDIIEACDTLKLEAYIVGGTVRDILLGDDIIDIDITVTGDTRRLSKRLNLYYGYDVALYPEFGTLSIKTDGPWGIDIVSARREVYTAPGALPKVYPSNLADDLGRRDFTINSMAISFKTGDLIDYYGGTGDLRHGLIRIMHSKGFIDDPTRILRGIRFAKRYGFSIEEETEALMNYSITRGYPTRLSNERILKELKCILSEVQSIEILRCIVTLGLWQLFFRGHTLSSLAYEKLLKVKKYGSDEIELKILALMEDLGDKDARGIFRPYRALYKNLKLYQDNNYKILYPIDGARAVGPGELYRAFSGLEDTTLKYIAITADTEEYREKVAKYLQDIRDFKFYITGGDLKALGIKPGPRYRDILERTRIRSIEQNVYDREGQLKILKCVITKGE